MFAVQIRVLVLFTIIVAFVIALAASALPASAVDSTSGDVTVGVRVARRVALSLPADAASFDADSLTMSNVECETSSAWVERGGQRVLMVTVVPTR